MSMNKAESLHKRIQTINEVLDVNKIVSLNPDDKYVARYYYLNKIPYSIFHTKSNLIHMGISRDGVYKVDDLQEAPRIVKSYIEKCGAKQVLELATGRGGNSIYLANLFPETTFYGVDLSPGQLDYAYKYAKSYQNYIPTQGDYHDLSKYEDESMDIVFEIEAVCYSQQKGGLLQEVKRVLKKDGYFILFDAYRDRRPVNQYETQAVQLVEKGMALQLFEEYNSFVKKVEGSGLQIVRDEDLSKYIMPTLKRFENTASRFFKHKLLAKIIASILPKEIIYNSASGYLMPDTVQQGLFTYRLTVLQKK